MRILFFVNHFDEADDLQGFFVGWVREVAQRVSSVIVLARHVGTYNVPGNVRVVSLDAENNRSRIQRLFRFIGALLRFRREYDHCVVIMAPLWSIIASLKIRFLGKTSYLWYAVWKGSFVLRLATLLSTRVLTSVPEAFPFASQKVVALGQGIDTDLFIPNTTSRESGNLLFLGRISPVKKIEFLLEGLVALRNSDAELFGNLTIRIAGAPINERDRAYYQGLQKKAQDLQLPIQWLGRIPHNETVSLHQKADIGANMTPAGSFDKAMLEAMACGTLVLASNDALRRYYPLELQEKLLYSPGNQEDFVQKLRGLLMLSHEEKDHLRLLLRRIIQEHHSQKQWTQKFLTALS